MKEMSFRNIMVFIVLSATVALAYQLPYLRYTFYDQMTAAYGLTNTEISFIATLVALVNTICYPIGGIFADKIKTKTLMLITLGSFVALSVWYAFTTDYIQLLVIHALFAFFGIATLWSAYLTSIRNLATEDNQSKIFGFSEATRGIIQTIIGFAFLAMMGAATAAAVNAETSAAGMRNMMLLGAGICAVFFVLALIFLPNPSKGEAQGDAEQAEPAKKYTFMDVMKNKGVWITIMIVMCAYVFWTLGNGYLTTYTVQALGMDESTATTVGIIRSYIIVFVAGFLGGFVMDRFSYKGLGFLVLFVLAIAFTLGVILSSAALSVCIVMTLVVAFVANIMKSTYWSVMGQSGIPAGMTALATGIISFIAFIPDWVTPIFCGIWLDEAEAAGDISAGFMKIFVTMIVFGVVGCVFSLILKRQTAKLRAAGEDV